MNTVRFTALLSQSFFATCQSRLKFVKEKFEYVVGLLDGVAGHVQWD